MAEAMFRCLESERVRGWVDLLEGEDEIREAVERVGLEGLDCIEGENVEAMVEMYQKGVVG